MNAAYNYVDGTALGDAGSAPGGAATALGGVGSVPGGAETALGGVGSAPGGAETAHGGVGSSFDGGASSLGGVGSGRVESAGVERTVRAAIFSQRRCTPMADEMLVPSGQAGALVIAHTVVAGASDCRD